MVSRLEELFEERIERTVKILVAGYEPEKIILFGSSLGRLAREESDIDLLIIKRTTDDPWERSLKVEHLVKRDFPVDMLVYTPSEIRERLSVGDFFIEDVIEKGRVVYEKLDRKRGK